MSEFSPDYRDSRKKSLLSVPGVREALQAHFERQGVTEEGRDLVLRAFEAPVRRVGGGGNNVVVRYASRKMGVAVQCESRNVELAFVELCEFDPEVQFYVCQPGKLWVSRENVRERMKGNWVTLDYLVVSRDGICLVECKPPSALRKDAASANPRFVRDDAAGWRWPAAEAAAAELGLGFRVFSSEEINPTWHRNMRFLADFLETDCPDTELARVVQKKVSEAGSMRIDEVLALPDMKAEVLWWLIAQDAVWADLEFELLRDGEMSSVHGTEPRMIANRERHSLVSDEALSHRVSAVQLEPGSRLSWNARRYVVVNRSPEDVWLREAKEGARSFAISLEDVREFLGTGAITGVESECVDDIHRERGELLCGASDEELEAALKRRRFLEEYRETGKKPAGVSMRSLRRYEARYRKGERVFGNGLCGLIGQPGRRPGKSDMGEKQQEILLKILEEFVDDKNAGHLANAYARMVADCEKQGIFPVPCKETLRLALEKRRKDKVAHGREGERAAYQVSGPLATDDPVIPRKADRVWQVAHLDHVLVKIELVSGHTGAPLGKAWLTLMIDDFTRMPLAMRLCFDEPSRVAVLKVFFDCVRRHNRLPEYIVVDQGPEFNSNDVEAAFAVLKINKVERPCGKPRFGSVIERMFGTTNTRLIHELPGNVKRQQRSRTVSRSHDPKEHATLSLRRLNELLDAWLFDEYPDLFHESLGETTPREVYRANLAYSGDRSARYIPIDMGLRMVLSVTPKRPTRKVAEGGVIKVEGFRYHDKALLVGNVVGSTVAVKLDAEDCSVVYVWLGRKWVACRLTDGNAELAGRSRKEAGLILEEIQQQYLTGARAAKLNAGKIGRHLRNLDFGQGVARQAERDNEARSISGNGLVEDEQFLCDEESSEVSPVESDQASADKGAEAIDSNDVLAGARVLKVVRR